MKHVIGVIIFTVITSAFLGLVLWGSWNYGVREFFPNAPIVSYLASIIVTFGFQILSFFRIQKPLTQPIFFPYIVANKND